MTFSSFEHIVFLQTNKQKLPQTCTLNIDCPVNSLFLWFTFLFQFTIMVTALTFKYTVPQDCYIFVQSLLIIMYVFKFFLSLPIIFFLDHVQKSDVYI